MTKDTTPTQDAPNTAAIAETADAVTDNRPLMLCFPTKDNKYIVEHLPTSKSRFGKWLRNSYMELRELLGKDLYYWHVRHRYTPQARKMQDIGFLMHVISEHGERPTDRVESRHYNRAWKIYEPEIRYLLSEIKRNNAVAESEEQKIVSADGTLPYAQPYMNAYIENWMNRLPIKEFDLLYHGVSYGDVLDLDDIITVRIRQKLEELKKDKSNSPSNDTKVKKKRTKNPKNSV